MNFLTVEDVNSTLLNYGNVNEFYVMDSAKIPFDNDNKSFYYDFILISKENNYFYFNVYNSLWTGGYYITDKDGNYLRNVTITYVKSRFAYTFTGELPDGFKLHLYMTNYHDKFNLVQLVANFDNLQNFNIKCGESFSYRFNLENLYKDANFQGLEVTLKIGDDITLYSTVDSKNTVWFGLGRIDESKNCSISIGNNTYYFIINILKNNFIFNLDADLIVGAVNKIKINPSIDAVGVTGSITVNGIESDINFEDGEFTVDLTKETVPREISIIVKVNESDKYYGYTHEFKFTSHYFRPNSFAELKQELEKVDGTPIIEVNSNISFESNINVNHDVLIKNTSDNFVIINLKGNTIIINENITFKIDNVNFMRGNPAIIQKVGSKVEINNSEFRFCENYHLDYAGSVICCDIDKNSLNNVEDFVTIINNSKFNNNSSCILHGGLLTIDNCKFKLTHRNYVYPKFPAFIYQVDGEATISNSIFDIDFENDSFNVEEIGFLQSIVMCGESAVINGANHKSLQSDDSLPFFDSNYNNKSHLFIVYYYENGIDSYVISSPVVNFEDKSCCHSVSGVDWIFKDNIQITREEWGTENTKRTITW